MGHLRAAAQGAALLILLTTACAHVQKPAAQHLAEEYVTFQGVRAAPAELRDSEERLDVFIGVLEEEPGGMGPLPEAASRRFADVLYCIAENPDEDPLPEVVERINAAPADKPIFLYGRAVMEKHKFWWGGIDCVFEAIAVWHVPARDYVYYDVGWATPWWRWGMAKDAFKEAIKSGGKAAGKAVKP